MAFVSIKVSIWHKRICNPYEDVGCQRWPNEVTAQHENSTWKRLYHNDVMREKRFPYYWPLMRSIHQWLVDFPHKGPVTWCFVASLNTMLNKSRVVRDLGPPKLLWHHWNTQDSHAHDTVGTSFLLVLTHSYWLLNLNSLKQFGNKAQ